MKRRIIKIIALIFLIVGADLLIGIFGRSIIEKVVETKRPSQAALIAYNFNKVDDDIVIVGSSTATCHIVPSIVRDSLSVLYNDSITCFNAGAYYQSIPYCHVVLQGVFSRTTPKIVIMDVQPEQMFMDMSEEQKKPIRPYFSSNRYVRDLFLKNSTTIEKMKLFSNMYCLNGEIIKLSGSLRTSSDGVDGFDMHKEKLSSNPPYRETLVDGNAKPVCEEELKGIINLCKVHNCRLFVVVSPFLNHTYSSDYYLDYLDSICSSNDVPVFNYLNDKTLQDHNLFRDVRHLNYDGAVIFTSMISSEMKRCILRRENNNE